MLSDPEKRAQYDRFGHGRRRRAGPATAGFGTIFEDLFEGFFGGGGGGRRATARGAGDDLRYDLEITLEEAAQGLETKLQIPRLETCETCRGTGASRAPARDLRARAAGRARCASRRASSPWRGRAPVPRRGADHQQPLHGLPRRGPRGQRAHAQGHHPAPASRTATSSGSPARARAGSSAGPPAISTSCSTCAARDLRARRRAPGLRAAAHLRPGGARRRGRGAGARRRRPAQGPGGNPAGPAARAQGQGHAAPPRPGPGRRGLRGDRRGADPR